jgi:hypothetical protein
MGMSLRLLPISLPVYFEVRLPHSSTDIALRFLLRFFSLQMYCAFLTFTQSIRLSSMEDWSQSFPMLYQ